MNRASKQTPTARLVDTVDLPIYPLDESTRLTAHYFTMFWHDRWLNSELHLTATLEVQACALNLFFIAQKQMPIGTLPDNNTILAKLLRIELSIWLEIRERTISPLHHWEKCLCGTEIRLMHPVVTEVVMAAVERREQRETSNTEKAAYQRLQRLRDAMIKIGLSKSEIADEALIGRMDQWLMDNRKGQQRRAYVYESVFEHAVRQKWIGREANHM